MDKNIETRIHELVFKSVEGIISEPECRELETLVSRSKDARELYSKCIKLNIKMLSLKEQFAGSSDLSMIVPGPADQQHDDDMDDSYTDVLKVLSEKETTAPTVEIEKPPVVPPVVKVEPVTPVDRKPKLIYHIYYAALSMAAMFMVLFIVYTNYFKPYYAVPVATVNDQINVEWAAKSEALKNNERVLTNQPPYRIEKGYIKISYDQGVDVVIEGPAEFEIERSGIYLAYGRIFSSVSEAGYGFTVESPHARFIDHGTEFGIQVRQHGTSELHVIDGEVEFCSSKGKKTTRQTVRENNALSYDSSAGKVGAIPFKKEEFVRGIHSDTGIIWRGQDKINLADIVGGGNGLGTGVINHGIDREGKIRLLNTVNVLFKDETFVPVDQSPYIDGIFYPNGLTPVDSKGDQFAGFEASRGNFYLGVLNGAWHQHSDSSVPRHALRLNGINFGSLEHPAIYMHANQGITFDLQAIRNYTKMDLSRFVAQCGLSESYGDYIADILRIRKGVNEKPMASFYVLVDGQEKFVRKDASYLDGPITISIDLEPTDHYLTLATTQGSDQSNNGDWTLFAEPAVELAQ